MGGRHQSDLEPPKPLISDNNFKKNTSFGRVLSSKTSCHHLTAHSPKVGCDDYPTELTDATGNKGPTPTNKPRQGIIKDTIKIHEGEHELPHKRDPVRTSQLFSAAAS